PAPSLHDRDPFQRLERAQQDATADAGHFAADIERIPTPVDKVDVGVAALKKHRTVARRLAAKMVRRGVADDVGFAFDDASTGLSFGMVADQDLSDPEPGEG